jgi:hypothetical protein
VQKDDLLILFLALALLLAMIITYIYRGERSMHGYGIEGPNAGQQASVMPA